MPTKMVTLEIKTAFPGEVVRALRKEAKHMRLAARMPDLVDRFHVMSADFKADELDRVAEQILAGG